jgi:hypothetical protein
MISLQGAAPGSEDYTRSRENRKVLAGSKGVKSMLFIESIRKELMALRDSAGQTGFT